MLVLTRRVGETIKIGNSVTITVLGVHGRQVQLGIEAPKSVSIYREELFNRINAEAGIPRADIAQERAKAPRGAGSS